MFNIEARFEDCKINAYSDEGHTYKVQVEDTHTGEISPTETLTALQVSYILQFCLHPDGEPEGYQKMYESLEPIYKDYPVNLRPMP